RLEDGSGIDMGEVLKLEGRRDSRGHAITKFIDLTPSELTRGSRDSSGFYSSPSGRFSLWGVYSIFALIHIPLDSKEPEVEIEKLTQDGGFMRTEPRGYYGYNPAWHPTRDVFCCHLIIGDPPQRTYRLEVWDPANRRLLFSKPLPHRDAVTGV